MESGYKELQKMHGIKPPKLAETITMETIKWWDTHLSLSPNAVYLIKAQTGKGKSHFIKHKLSAYSKEKGREILLLINRIAPIKQFEAELEREGIDN